MSNKPMPAEPTTMPWYTLGDPWAHGDYAGTVILAGSPDPHVGIALLDTSECAEEVELEACRLIAAHIADLHNAAIEAAPSPEPASGELECIWTQQDNVSTEDTSWWNIGCGGEFLLNWGTPSDHFSYCGCCGKPIGFELWTDDEQQEKGDE